MALGVLRRFHASWGGWIRQLDFLQLACFGIVVVRLDLAEQRPVWECQRVAGQVVPAQRDRGQRLAASALSFPPGGHDQLAVLHRGRGPVLPGQAGDEVHVRLVDLVGPWYISFHLAHGLQLVPPGNVAHDAGQLHALPTVALLALHRGGDVGRLGADNDALRRPADLDFIDLELADERQRLALISEADFKRCSLPGESDGPVAVVDVDLALVSLQPRLIGGADGKQPVAQQCGDVFLIGDHLKIWFHGVSSTTGLASRPAREDREAQSRCRPRTVAGSRPSLGWRQ